MALSSNIKIYRLKHRISIEEFSRKVGVNEVTAREWELGIKEPTLNELIIISSVFDIELDDLLSSNKVESRSQVREELSEGLLLPKKYRDRRTYIIIAGSFSALIILTLILSILFTRVPAVQGTSKDVAIQRLITLGFIPTEKYEFDSNIEQGLVIQTNPKSKGLVLRGSRIEVTISKGSPIVYSTNWVIQWTNLLSYSYGYYKADKWNLESVYIDNEKNVMVIEFDEVILQAQYAFQGTETPGQGFGKAYIYGPEFLEAPMIIKYKDQFFEVDSPNSFVVEIPLTGFDNKKPTNLELEIVGSVQSYYGLVNQSLFVTLTISW